MESGVWEPVSLAFFNWRWLNRIILLISPLLLMMLNSISLFSID